MTATYDCIATTTLGSDTASVTFSSISGSFTDLVLVGELTGSGGNANIRVRVNSDSGTNYSLTRLSGDGSSATSARGSNSDGMFVVSTGASLNGNRGVFIQHFMNYSNTTTNKTALNRFSVAASEVTTNVHLWRSTSAITSIEIATTTNNYASGSTFTLYGIKSE